MGDGEGDDDPGAGRTSFMLTVDTMLLGCDDAAISQTGGRSDVSDRLLLRATGTGAGTDRLYLRNIMHTMARGACGPLSHWHVLSVSTPDSEMNARQLRSHKARECTESELS